MTPFFVPFDGDQLAQGDLLTNCPIPSFSKSFVDSADQNGLSLCYGDLIVVTQSCDLENRKVSNVSLCPFFPLEELAKVDTKFGKPKERENIRKGRYEALHMLASPETPSNNSLAIVVDFRQIYSLPIDFLSHHAEKIGPRWRLTSPFLEHFSQSFAKFFMRIGLPSSIPEFR